MQLKQLQKLSLNILIDIDNICKKNNIKYFLIGGSLIGAIRHKGFIPWDDDIDIAMLRKDYNKFKKIMLSRHKSIPYYLHILCDEIGNYPFNYLKIKDNRTKIIEKELEHLNLDLGVNIDVFPLDGSPNNYFIRKIHLFKISLIKKTVLLGFFYKNKKSKFKYYVGKTISAFLNLNKLKKILEELASKYDVDNSDTIYNYFGAWGNKEHITKKSIGNKTSRVEFESYVFETFDNPDEWLKNIYGDYMELPPENKRKSHHNIKLIKY